MLKALFDFSFSEFVTIKLIKFSFGFGLVVSAIIAISMGVMVDGVAMKLFGLVFVTPIAFIILALLTRLFHEMIVVLFRIAEASADISRNTKVLSARPVPQDHVSV
jgi:hypothetical protein